MKLLNMRNILLFLLLQSLNGFSQALTIDETVAYLNKLSTEHPGKGYYESNIDAIFNAGSECELKIVYKLSYDSKKNLVSINEVKDRINCSSYFKTNVLANQRQEWTKYGYQYKIDFSDFDENNIKLIKEKKDYYIYLSGDFGQYEYDVTQNKYSGLGILVHGFYLRIDNISYLKVYLNGLKYLISIAKEQIPEEKEEVVDDPFLKNKSESQKQSIKTESKISLLEENGVFSLNVTIGGKVQSKFILDSGAGECNISSEFEKKLIANGIIKQADYLDNGLYKIADGSIVENKRIKISKIRIGNRTISNVIVSVGSSSSPNLLGQTFLNKLNQWSIDNSKKQLIIK